VGEGRLRKNKHFEEKKRKMKAARKSRTTIEIGIKKSKGWLVQGRWWRQIKEGRNWRALMGSQERTRKEPI